MHHGFDDSADDYDMDMDQRTRMLGRGGRIILLGDGTEILTGRGDDDDVDMDERGDAEEDSDEKDFEELLRSKNSAQKVNGDSSETKDASDDKSKVDESKQRQAETTITDEPKPVVDIPSNK